MKKYLLAAALLVSACSANAKELPPINATELDIKILMSGTSLGPPQTFSPYCTSFGVGSAGQFNSSSKDKGRGFIVPNIRARWERRK
jgi:hypothetical protein